MLDYLTAGPDDATHCVIWLHGLGADGHDFLPLAESLAIPKLRYLFPHAPVQPVTLNIGQPMRAWYDIYSLERGGPEDQAGIEKQSQALAELIEQQIERGMTAERIFLAGFSQGGVMSLHLGLRYSPPLGGILALSGYLALAEQLPQSTSSSPDIFMAHGLYDDVVRLDYAKHSRDRLMAAGYTLDWQSYPMAHNVSDQELIDLRAWLIARMDTRNTSI